MYSETLLGSTDTFKVMIHHIDSLFGIALRIRYDPEIISITGVIPGDVFSSADFIFFPWVDSDYVALGYSLQARQDTLGVNLPQGVSPRSATIAEIVYEARGLGPTTLNFLQEEGKSPKLIDWQGNPLPRQEHLYIENGEVEVYGP
ncbi:MAG: hypothetical protein KAT58_09470, partial [candidate division Zixibacteria bacterium]|nr:hypothetical protein [candidate division Zixibacteria bacterium]